MNRQKNTKDLGGLVVSDKKIVFMFSLYLANVKIVTPGRGHLLPQCHYLNRLGRSLLDNASH